MKVLVIGSGGREHALAWRLARSESVSHVYAAPGNPGIAQLGTCIPVPDLSPATLLRVAHRVEADLAVVGPEAPLVHGVVDSFQAARIPIVGPTKEQARLEGSKVYAKSFFARNGIPTARFESVETAADALDVLHRFTPPVVIKADGLASGKGVTISNNFAQAEEAIRLLGPRLVIEECLHGREVSFIVLSDGRRIVELPPCQDHKQIHDGDRGPNTGGMGAYSDDCILSEAESQQIMNRIILPTIDATHFTGFLFAGLMMTSDGPKILEYNVRLGDPETQAIMHRFDGDLGALLLSTAHGELDPSLARWRPEPSVCVVLASEGYPGPHRSGDAITGISEAESTGATVFQAGTTMNNGRLETAGGRVLGPTACGATLQEAIDSTYNAVSRIHFTGMQFRRDIGRKGLQ